MMKLKIYADRMSQPSRAIIIFCKVNRIDFEEVRVDLAKRQHLSPEFKVVNPMGQVPAIVDGRFQLFESHAILIYLACAFPGIADNWYPNDLFKRAKIHSVLDWHHSNLRRGAAPFLLNTVLGPALGIKVNPQAAAEAEKLLFSSLSKIESFWLKGNAKFLLGSSQPSIADLSLVCEIMQLEILDEGERNRILGPYKKVQQWIENTKNATRPHFDEVHAHLFGFKARLFGFKARLQKPPSGRAINEASKKGHCIQRCENHVACIIEKICDYKFADSKCYRSGCVVLVLLQESCYLYCYKICNYEFAE